MCVGLAEVRSRQVDFSQDSRERRLRYLRSKPIPLVCLDGREFWMVDRHHRLRGLIEIDPQAAARAYFGKDVADLQLHEAAFLAILPKALAHDFLRFAQANPKPVRVVWDPPIPEDAPHVEGYNVYAVTITPAAQPSSRIAKARTGVGNAEGSTIAVIPAAVPMSVQRNG